MSDIGDIGHTLCGRCEELSAKLAATERELQSIADASLKFAGEANVKLAATELERIALSLDLEKVQTEFDQVERERDEARDWVRRMVRETQELRCAFCGQPYPPETPGANDERLTEHIKVCAKHPMRALEAALAEARRALEEARGSEVEAWTNATAWMKRHDEMLALIQKRAPELLTYEFVHPWPTPEDAPQAIADAYERGWRERGEKVPHLRWLGGSSIVLVEHHNAAPAETKWCAEQGGACLSLTPPAGKPRKESGE